jgi:kumamolisin
MACRIVQSVPSVRLVFWVHRKLIGGFFMKWKAALALAVCAILVLTTPFPASSQNGKNSNDDDEGGHFAHWIPDSSIEKDEDMGIRAHTNHVIRIDASSKGNNSTPSGETPTSLRAVYNIPSSGGSGIIAIVDAYDYPTAENDLNVFSSQFGLPSCTTANGCFTKMYASGRKPAGNCGWDQEAALDIEWAHAMAPNAKILFVEAASSSFNDLFSAVDAASNYILKNSGYGEVSMSWGGSEFNGETSFDSHFTKPGVVYFAASGDTGGATIYPGASLDVVSAGGTSVNRNSSGAFVSETGWSGSGGGASPYEPKPNYQSGVPGTSSTHRSVPDFSFDANPSTGVAVYDSTSCQGLSGWLVFGGTSVASPSLAGIVNLAGHHFGSTSAELSVIYGNFTNGNDFRDITSGRAGKNNCGPGYDFVTGVGSNQGTQGK